MSGGEWYVGVHGRLLRGGTPVSALQVLADIESEDGSSLRRELPHLAFSRRALIPRLCVEGEFPQGLFLRLCVSAAAHRIDIGIADDSVVINGTWFAVHAQSLGQIAAVIERRSIAIGSLDVGRYLELSSTPEVLPYLEDSSLISDTELWSARTMSLDPPAQLTAQLFDYQVEGSNFMRVLTRLGVGCLLADEMGLGKTVQTIAVIADQEHGTKTLVVCPVSLLENWRREFSLFAPMLKVLIHYGSDRTGVPAGFEGCDVVLSPYGTVVADRGLMAHCEWDIVVLDEAQNIRNPDSRRSIEMKRLRRRVSIAMTGTPVENSLQDMFSISEFVLPSLLGARDEFTRMFPDVHEAAERLGAITAPVVMRRKVVDVAGDLPPIVESELVFALDDLDRIEYERVESESPGLSGIQLLRVLCAHAVPDLGSPVTSLEARNKVQFLLDRALELGERSEKALIFSSFTKTLDRLAYLLSVHVPGAFVNVVDGRMSVPERQKAVDRFGDFEGPGFMLLNPAAAGVGLNITSANHVFHFNPEWNPQVTRQATARSYRRGQTKPVFVWHLFYGNTVEENARRLAEAKLGLAGGVDDGLDEILRSEGVGG